MSPSAFQRWPDGGEPVKSFCSAKNFSAQDALLWGLVQEIVSNDELGKSIGQWLDQLLSCSPGAVRLQKQLIRSWEDMPLRPAIEAGIDSFATAVRTGEPAAAMRNFLERQKARKTRS